MADTTPDYSEYLDDGQKYNREQVAQSCYYVAANVHQIFITSNIQQLHLLSSGEVVVVGTDHFTGSVYNRNLGMNVPISVDMVEINYWIKTIKGWRMKRSRILLSKKTINGRATN